MPVRRIVVGSVGGLTLTAGIAMIVLPGPAVLFIPLGLGILATEFKWARKTLERGADSLKRWASGPRKTGRGSKGTHKENVT